MHILWQDIRYGIRGLLKHPGFTLVALITLALGIGANTAIFTVVNAVLLRPLPFAEPQQLVFIWQTHPFGKRIGVDKLPSSYRDFLDWQEQSNLFEGMAMLDGWGGNLTGGDTPEHVDGARVSVNLLSLLRARPALGSDFTAENAKPGNERVVMLSYGLWQRRFGGDASVVGRQMQIDGQAYTIQGVMGKDFAFPKDVGLPDYFSFEKTEVWLPAALSDQQRKNRESHHLAVLARLKPGATLAQAQSQMAAVARNIEQQDPKQAKDWGTSVNLVHEQVVGSSRKMILILLGAVGFVLLIACANVANLLLARATSRQKEIAIRTALGAGRLRIVRQLLTESVLLSLVGGTLGVLLASWSVKLLVAYGSGRLPRLGEINIDGRVLWFTFAVSLITGVLFGLVPALQASKTDLNESLKESGRSAMGGRRRQRARSMLVVSEVALSLVLLIGAGLLIKSFVRLQNVKPGFAPDHLLTINLALPQAKYKEDAQMSRFFEQVVERARAIPGVEVAAAVSHLPLSGQEELDGFTVEGRPAPVDLGQIQTADFRVITPDYFRAMQIPLRKGRYFTDQDRANTANSIIIDETFARQVFPGEDPVGKRIDEQGGRADHGFATIIGVVGSVKHTDLSIVSRPAMYVVADQNPWQYMTLVIRSKNDPAMLTSAVRREVAAVDKDQPLSEITTMDELFAKAVAPQRFNMLLVGLFAALALMLATVGIYGVIGYSVTQRLQEMGVRLALGASARDILRLIIGRAMLTALIGIGLGLIAAFALTRVMTSLLYEVSATDPAIFAGLSVLLVGVALIASYIPARRATKVDPLVALRYE
ncbi:MAG TPA: ABC transporter permease [Pyrinomonadaceae bacterium]|nr:ABC transporter permease [Pyrinomonadaceae bacterium]